MMMYIDLIRRVLEQAVDAYASANGKSVSEVLTAIRTHIDSTAKEHQAAEPDIKYEEPLCRLGYLYRHATANATLFEHVLRESGELRSVIRQSAEKRLSMCALGGGPGTELLGLAKYLLRSRGFQLPKKITFTLMDVVPQWAETWQQLAEAVEDELQSGLQGDDSAVCPAIANSFLPLDALKAESFNSFGFQFSGSQVIIFNYLFSENKTRLAEAKAAVASLYAKVPKGCVFVVIDRLENNRTFSDGVVSLFQELFAKQIAVHQFGRTLDGDEQTTDMGELFYKTLGNPRVKFFTDMYRNPTVFWFTAVKE
jgi:hypothetical protein